MLDICLTFVTSYDDQARNFKPDYQNLDPHFDLYRDGPRGGWSRGMKGASEGLSERGGMNGLVHFGKRVLTDSQRGWAAKEGGKELCLCSFLPHPTPLLSRLESHSSVAAYFLTPFQPTLAHSHSPNYLPLTPPKPPARASPSGDCCASLTATASPGSSQTSLAGNPLPASHLCFPKPVQLPGRY
jgi:hypothetical protein